MSTEEVSPHEPNEGRASRGRPLDSWRGGITKSIAREIRHWREARGLTIQELAEITDRLGAGVKKSVIANIETNRRDSVDVSELLVIAAALNVPPVLLIAPVGRQDMIEALPEVHMSSWEMRGWIHGARTPLHEAFEIEQWKNARLALTLYDVHRTLVGRFQQAQERIRDFGIVDDLHRAQADAETDQRLRGLIEANERDHAFLDSAVEHLLERIRAHRNLIDDLGLVVPELSADVASALANLGEKDKDQVVVTALEAKST